MSGNLLPWNHVCKSCCRDLCVAPIAGSQTSSELLGWSIGLLSPRFPSVLDRESRQVRVLSLGLFGCFGACNTLFYDYERGELMMRSVYDVREAHYYS